MKRFKSSIIEYQTETRQGKKIHPRNKFAVGDKVQVVSGTHTGETGIVVLIERRMKWLFEKKGAPMFNDTLYRVRFDNGHSIKTFPYKFEKVK